MCVGLLQTFRCKLYTGGGGGGEVEGASPPVLPHLKVTSYIISPALYNLEMVYFSNMTRKSRKLGGTLTISLCRAEKQSEQVLDVRVTVVHDCFCDKVGGVP